MPIRFKFGMGIATVDLRRELSKMFGNRTQSIAKVIHLAKPTDVLLISTNFTLGDCVSLGDRKCFDFLEEF